MNKFKYIICDGSGYEETIDVADMDEAVEHARDVVAEGAWGDDGASISVDVVEFEIDEDGDEETLDIKRITVEIPPNEWAMIRRAVGCHADRSCGDEPTDHKWTSEGESGCEENPGVWSTGGTGLAIAEHCVHCGLSRVHHHQGSQRNPGEIDSVTYTWDSDRLANNEDDDDNE